MSVQEPQTTAIAIVQAPERAWSGNLLQGAYGILSRTGEWATSTAQQFGALVSALMGPAVLITYALAAWSLAANLGWTSTFFFTAGPLSNWIVWIGIATAVHVSAEILKRHTQPGR